jgi:hypothetical protein
LTSNLDLLLWERFLLKIILHTQLSRTLGIDIQTFLCHAVRMSNVNI